MLCQLGSVITLLSMWLLVDLLVIMKKRVEALFFIDCVNYSYALLNGFEATVKLSKCFASGDYKQTQYPEESHLSPCFTLNAVSYLWKKICSLKDLEYLWRLERAVRKYN